MKMKIEKLLVMSLLSLAIFSCSKEDDIIDLPVTPPVPEEPVTPPEPEPVYLSINPYIAGVEPVTRGIITNFTDNDRLDIFLTDGELGTNLQRSQQIHDN